MDLASLTGPTYRGSDIVASGESGETQSRRHDDETAYTRTVGCRALASSGCRNPSIVVVACKSMGTRLGLPQLSHSYFTDSFSRCRAIWRGRRIHESLAGGKAAPHKELGWRPVPERVASFMTASPPCSSPAIPSCPEVSNTLRVALFHRRQYCRAYDQSLRQHVEGLQDACPGFPPHELQNDESYEPLDSIASCFVSGRTTIITNSSPLRLWPHCLTSQVRRS